MANRRRFLAASAGLGMGAVAMTSGEGTQAAEDTGRDLLELRRYHLGDSKQKEPLDAFFRDAAIPAWNRIGVSPVGVFFGEKEASPIYVLLRHKSMETVLEGNHKLAADAEFQAKGADLINAPADAPAFKRIESSLLLAFKGMPNLEVPPHSSPDRVLQLRIYESPSVKTGQKKIEMFNDAGEIAIFRRTGLRPVFFGEAIVGDKLPNLTYMLAFDTREALDANWKTFVGDPEWKTLSKRAEYADKAILSGITNLILKPAPYSQI